MEFEQRERVLQSLLGDLRVALLLFLIRAQAEREMVLRLCEWRGVEKDSPAWEQLNNWLDERPSDDFFLKTLRIIRHLPDVQMAKEQVASRTDLISFCIRIANASGGFLGVGSKVSADEQTALDQIVEELNRKYPEAVRQVVEGS